MKRKLSILGGIIYWMTIAAAQSDPLANWTQVAPLTAFGGIVFAAGRFFLGGSYGAILTSTNGTDWSPLGSGVTNQFGRIAYGNGRFAAISGSHILTATDVGAWSVQSTFDYVTFSDIAYGNGAFVAVGDAVNVVTSTNGIDWISQSFGSGVVLSRVVYGDGKFVAVGTQFGRFMSQNGFIATSSDGINWVTQATSLAYQFSGVAFGSGEYVATAPGFGFASYVYTSTNGLNWTPTQLPDRIVPNEIAYGGGVFVAGRPSVPGQPDNAPDGFWASPDGTNWTSLSASFSPEVMTGGAYGNGTFVAVGSSKIILASTNNVAWSQVAQLPVPALDDTFTSIVRGGGVWVAAAKGGGVFASHDSEAWSRSAALSFTPAGLAYGLGLFVAVGSNQIATSLDATTWLARDSGLGTNALLRSVAFGNGTFVAVGGAAGQNRILTSADGVTWTSQRPASSNYLSGVTYGNGEFVAVGVTDTETSVDGIHWSAQTDYAGALNSVAYGDGLFVAVGNTVDRGIIRTSTNGISWTKMSEPISLGSIAFGGGSFVCTAFGYDPSDYFYSLTAMLTSTNGVTWTSRTNLVTTVARNGSGSNAGSLAYGAGRFVVVTRSGLIARSDSLEVGPPIDFVHSTTGLTLLWPTNAVLQQNSKVGTRDGWNDVTQPPVLTNSMNSLLFDVSKETRFFRAVVR